MTALSGGAPPALREDEVRNLRRALEWELASARLRPGDLILDAFDRACVRAAARPGQQGGPLNPPRAPRIVRVVR